MILVLAEIDERRPIPPGVVVRARVLATGGDTNCRSLDLGGPDIQAGTMLLTLDEAADQLRLSTRQVERLAKDGTLPTVTVPDTRGRRVRRSDLEEFVANLQPSGAAS